LNSTAALAETRAANSNAILLVGSMGCAMTVLDTNVVGIILPTLAHRLNASFADIEWVISAYVLSFSALLLPAGAIADRFGRKRLLLIGIAIFALASLACGLAPSAVDLYIARAAQGVGAAFLLAPALAVINHTYHEERLRTRAWAIWGGIMGLTMVLSPLIGGAINAALGWRYAFHLNVPICAVLAFAVWKVTEESRDPAPRDLDLPGIALFTAGMFFITWALISGPVDGWMSLATSVRFAIGICLLIAFSLVERRQLHPMLDIRLFHAPAFVGAVLAMFAYAASAQVMASLLPLFLQNAKGNSALAASVGMLPFAVAMLLFPQLGRRLSSFMKSYQILTLGLGVVGVGNLIMMYAAQTHGATIQLLGMAVIGSGGGLLNGETQKAIMGTVPRHRSGMASGISTTARFSGILLGFASLGAVLADGVRTAVQTNLSHMQVTNNPAFVEHVVAGDFDRALSMYPHGMSGTLIRMAQESYAQGFSGAFLVAAVIAMLIAAVAYMLMRRP
jgi:EmrB/QacA subfamily drug resistance transporter